MHCAYRRHDHASIVDASRHVAEAAHACGARLVHVSTDALFAGRDEPYTEADVPDPVHDYGRWKAEAEAEVAAACPDALIVRTSLIYGNADPSPYEDLVREVMSGHRDFTFFTDEVRSPVLVDDLARALVALAATREPTGVLHLGGGQAFSRSELAVMVARRGGWEPSRLSFSTIAESGQDRPERVVLDSSLAASYGISVHGPAAWDH